MQQIDVLNLRTEEGLKSVPLEQITSLSIRDDQLDQELSRALEVLGSALQTEEKRVSFSFNGDGRRDVQIGYIQQMPVWKMAYRLVLDSD